VRFQPVRATRRRPFRKTHWRASSDRVSFGPPFSDGPRNRPSAGGLRRVQPAATPRLAWGRWVWVSSRPANPSSSATRGPAVLPLFTPRPRYSLTSRPSHSEHSLSFALSAISIPSRRVCSPRSQRRSCPLVPRAAPPAPHPPTAS